MEKKMSLGKMIKGLAEENQTRKVLEILNDCKDIEEAKRKVKALLNE